MEREVALLRTTDDAVVQPRYATHWVVVLAVFGQDHQALRLASRTAILLTGSKRELSATATRELHRAHATSGGGDAASG
jgi:hypothetical protein